MIYDMDSVSYVVHCTLYIQKVKKQVLAANIGDSRCVISRAGLAIDMSFDHKPEDDIELKRIIKAGGFLTGNVPN